MDDRSLYALMAWLSPGYPVGAFSYSHGLETAVAAGLVANRDALRDWIATILACGDGRIDACLFAAAYDAASRRDSRALTDLCARARAQRPSAEIALESEAQGEAFLSATRKAWPHPWLDRLRSSSGGAVAYPLAVAVAAAAFGISRRAGLVAYLHALVANLASAGMRLIPLGQSDGQAVIAGLAGAVEVAAARAPREALDEIGTATPMVDWCTIAHETQYARLFRS